MKISDLKIGNYIYCQIEPLSIYIDIVRKIDLVGNKINDIDISHFFPIEINEDILVRSGFLKKERDGRYGYIYYLPIVDYNYVIARDFNEYQSHFFGFEYTDSPNEEDDYKPHYIAYDIRYLHHLQNIYSSLLQGNDLTFINNELIFNYES